MSDIKDTDEYHEMPLYPKEGYMRIIDGYLVINLKKKLLIDIG